MPNFLTRVIVFILNLFYQNSNYLINPIKLLILYRKKYYFLVKLFYIKFNLKINMKELNLKIFF